MLGQVRIWKDLHGILCYASDAQRVLDLGLCLGKLGGVLLHFSFARIEGQPFDRNLGRPCVENDATVGLSCWIF